MDSGSEKIRKVNFRIQAEPIKKYINSANDL